MDSGISIMLLPSQYWNLLLLLLLLVVVVGSTSRGGKRCHSRTRDLQEEQVNPCLLRGRDYRGTITTTTTTTNLGTIITTKRLVVSLRTTTTETKKVHTQTQTPQTTSHICPDRRLAHTKKEKRRRARSSGQARSHDTWRGREPTRRTRRQDPRSTRKGCSGVPSLRLQKDEGAHTSLPSTSASFLRRQPCRRLVVACRRRESRALGCLRFQTTCS